MLGTVEANDAKRESNLTGSAIFYMPVLCKVFKLVAVERSAVQDVAPEKVKRLLPGKNHTRKDPGCFVQWCGGNTAANQVKHESTI